MHATDQVKCAARIVDAQRGALSVRLLRVAFAGTLAAMLFTPGLAWSVPVCSMTTTADLLFPVYDVFATLPTDTSATVTVKCPKGATVTIDKGNAPTYDPRLMKGAGPDVLAYNLFLGGYSTIWGDGTGGTSTWITPTGNATATIYARIPAGQDVSAGAYSDSVVLTVFP